MNCTNNQHLIYLHFFTVQASIGRESLGSIVVLRAFPGVLNLFYKLNPSYMLKLHCYTLPMSFRTIFTCESYAGCPFRQLYTTVNPLKLTHKPLNREPRNHKPTQQPEPSGNHSP